jgi:hypothetical protein
MSYCGRETIIAAAARGRWLSPRAGPLRAARRGRPPPPGARRRAVGCERQRNGRGSTSTATWISAVESRRYAANGALRRPRCGRRARSQTRARSRAPFSPSWLHVFAPGGGGPPTKRAGRLHVQGVPDLRAAPAQLQQPGRAPNMKLIEQICFPLPRFLPLTPPPLGPATQRASRSPGQQPVKGV